MPLKHACSRKPQLNVKSPEDMTQPLFIVSTVGKRHRLVLGLIFEAKRSQEAHTPLYFDIKIITC